MSEKIGPICHPLRVRVICRSQHILRQALMKVKSARPDNRKKGIVYEIPCTDCDCMYIGETSRYLEMRLKEHKYMVKNNDTKNGVAVHAWDNDHHVKWDDVKVVAVEHHLTKRNPCPSERKEHQYRGGSRILYTGSQYNKYKC